MKWNFEQALHSKEDFQKLLQQILSPLLPYYTEGRAGLDVGITGARFDRKAILFEGFSRILWGLAPLLAGGGEAKEFEEIYLTGLKSGSDPESEECWEGYEDFDQRFVDMAAVGYALFLVPEKFWEPLSEETKDNLYNWLTAINEYQLPVCNWAMFQVLVNLAFKKVGRPFDQEKMEYYLNQIESFYLGDGWYRDGDSHHKDYYSSFAIGFYNLVYIREMKEEDPKRCQILRERAMEFGKQFAYWFDEDGAGIPYGRSLTYRFSQVSFYSACLIAEVHPLPISVMKGLIVKHLQDWLRRDIFDDRGILTIGYGYSNLYMSEIYNSPGSPYWALKTFAFLMLPDDHPFWSVKAVGIEESIGREEKVFLPHGEMLIWRYPHHTTAFVPGRYSPLTFGQYPQKYGKMAYDTKFSISISKSNFLLGEAAPDSMLAFWINDYIYVRRICEDYLVTDTKVYSKWIPYEGIVVETTITPNSEGHVREHLIHSEMECEAYDCGFAVEVDLKNEKLTEEGSWSQVSNEWSHCRVTSLEGAGRGMILPLEPNTNLLHQMALIPSVCYSVEKGENQFVTQITADYNRSW